MLQKDITDIIERFAPLELQAPYDHCGWKTGEPEREAKGVLVCLDLNESVVSEAEMKGCNLIIEHHPSIWSPWDKIDLTYPKVKALLSACQKNISVYSAHTNIDFAEGGLNDFFAKQIGLHNIENIGEGRIGILDKEMTLQEYTKYIADVIGDQTVRYIGSPDKSIRTVACINGAGGSDEKLICYLRKKTDVFVTAEIKYNVARLSKDLNYAIIEVGHFTSECGFTELISDLLHKNAPQIPVYKAETLLNPYM